MRLSVLVPVHNGGGDLRTCLQALQKSSRKPDEVIVIDDGSTDGAVACAGELSAKVVRVEGPLGPAVARNRGARNATGDVLVFVDADVVVHPDTLERFERVLSEHPEWTAVFGSYDDAPPAPSQVSRYKNLLHHYVHQHGSPDAETFWAGCGAIRRDVFLAVGGFAETGERLTIEDIELGARLRAAGHAIALRPEIQCTHLKQWTLASLLRTDIFVRAIPWSRLILRQGKLPSGLNTDRRSRWSALLAWLCFFAVAGAVTSAFVRCVPGVATLAGIAAASGAAVGLLNRDLYGFFFRHGSARFGLTAALLHFLYLLYSSSAFATVLVFERVGKTDGQPSAPPQAQPQRTILVGALLSLVLFAVYLANGEPLPGNDATPNVHLAAQVLSRGKLTYTPEENPSFFGWTVVSGRTIKSIRVRSWNDGFDGWTFAEHFRSGNLRNPLPAYYLVKTTKPGVYLSSYGVATGLFALPFVAAVAPFVQDLPAQTALLWNVSKVAAAFAVAASAFFIFLIAADHLRRSTAIALVLVYGLGTCVWSQSSQALWQHGPAELFLALGTFCLFRRERAWAPYLAGFSYALAFLCRPTSSVAAIAGFFLFLFTDRKAALRYVLGGLPLAVFFIAYNLHYFGTPIAFGQVTALADRLQRPSTASLWKTSLLSGLAGVLVSPSRGLFVFSPVVAVSFWGAVAGWRQRSFQPLRALLVAVVAMCLVVASWAAWTGGWCYGYRLLVDTTTLMAFMAIPIAERIRQKRWLAGVFSVLAAWSVLVQVVGAFAYDVRGWNNRPGIQVVLPGVVNPPSFPTQEQADAYCRPRGGCSTKPVEMDVDKPTFRERLWKLDDSEILFYLQNFSKSRQLKRLSYRQFLMTGV